jgi:hypothetical protein
VDIPPELLELRIAFLRADRRCRDIADALPAARDIIHGRAEITEDQAKEYQEARADRMKTVMALHRHPWIGSLPLEDRAPARRALEAAAVEALTVNA